MPVTLVDEVDEGPDQTRLRLIPPDEPRAPAAVPEARQPPAQPAPPARPVVQYPTEQVLAVMETLARFLALRALLFVGFLVASGLGLLVIGDPSLLKLVSLGLWAVLVYLPVVALSARQR